MYSASCQANYYALKFSKHRSSFILDESKRERESEREGYSHTALVFDVEGGAIARDSEEFEIFIDELIKRRERERQTDIGGYSEHHNDVYLYIQDNIL